MSHHHYRLGRFEKAYSDERPWLSPEEVERQAAELRNALNTEDVRRRRSDRRFYRHCLMVGMFFNGCFDEEL